MENVGTTTEGGSAMNLLAQAREKLAARRSALDRRVQSTELLGVGQDAHLDDPSVSDREAGDGERPPVPDADRASGTVDERRPHLYAETSERDGLAGDPLRAPETEAAVVEGIGRTGRLVTSAALILFLSFVAMASSPGTDIKIFATGLGAGILLDATVIRGLIVPAVISLMGRWNWWLPRWPARLLRVEPSLPPKVAVEGGGS
jgi:MMPL family